MAFLEPDYKYLRLCAFVTCAMVVINIRQVDADAVSGPGWNYKPGDFGGPDRWYENYPDCGGVMQSPVDIDTDEVLYDPHLELFNFYDYKITEGVQMQLENVGGHTAEVIFEGKELFLKDGSLPDKYVLEQFHFHWGQDDRRGSEHSINGEHFPMEVHFVHRQNRLPNMTVAAPHPYGLAVVAFMYKVGNENKNYNQLLDHFDKIINANEKVSIPTFPVFDLFPDSTRLDFFRYQGSLTTPPCSESVIWSIGTDMIEISEQQLNKFRALFDEEKHHLVDDFRPIQEINQRTVQTTHLLYRDKTRGTGSVIVPQLTTLVLAFLGLVISL